MPKKFCPLAFGYRQQLDQAIAAPLTTARFAARLSSPAPMPRLETWAEHRAAGTALLYLLMSLQW